MRIGTLHRAAVATIGFGIISAVLCCGNSAAGATNAASDSPRVDPATLARVRDAAMGSSWAWEHLVKLSDGVGPRLSGSPQLTAAVTEVANAMRSLGARGTLQAAKVPHWGRGEERAELIEYPGRRTGAAQSLRLTTLGGSSATEAGGLSARVIV